MANPVANLIFIPAPGLGHIMSTIEIAKLLVNRDQRLFITVLVIKPPRTGSGSGITTYIESLAKKSLDRITFIEVPQQENPPMSEFKSPMTYFHKFINNHYKYVRSFVAEMICQPGSGQVVGFVIDMFCTGMINVANEFNVPIYVFFTSNAAFLGFILHLKTLCDGQNQDVIELSNSDTVITIPSFVKPVPTKVFPSLARSKEDLDLFLWSAKVLRGAKAIIVNTYLELETHSIESFSADTSIPRVYPVGPILSLNAGAGKPSDDDIIGWLDSQPPSSVVFLCFGSMGSFDAIQVKEIAHALEQSGHRFLWSLRRHFRPPTSDTPSDYSRIGVVLPWWNSLLESLWFGVPLATWPIFAEQQINAFEMVVELGLSVEIKLDYRKNSNNPKAHTVIVTADEIESGIRRLMKDNDIKTKVKEMSNKSRAAVAEGGSSYASVGCLIQDFIRNLSVLFIMNDM
ncbi:hypothetical protein Tco_1095702 [Tanacetum coccineum]